MHPDMIPNYLTDRILNLAAKCLDMQEINKKIEQEGRTKEQSMRMKAKLMNQQHQRRAQMPAKPSGDQSPSSASADK
ncbi:hypothetical protein I7I50_06205 [Histoplasma capsulatum G186AR]|uniref:Uncharacterized protein n=1 Tax=Ajellomyces capsulatus TaxID=5037 RepID=A0A8H7Z1L8_AJECA|nr:hypothetical protein I7I52_10722 [Histoplasma capsulatum]QSS67194.1 hypothetical protein I7I50_06205 [Histoplasma capsulatum G186AR]